MIPQKMRLVRCHRLLLLGACLGLPWIFAPLDAAEIAVGPGHGHSRIESALDEAQPGDVILVHPQADNRPYEKVALFVNKAGITIKAKAEKDSRIPLSGAGFDYSGRGSVPRAIVQFNMGADGCVIEGFSLSGAHNESHNGAGIRINGANDIVVRHCEIHGNDMGIMSNGDGTRATAVNQLIEGCLIHGNGAPADPGYNHNLYLGGTNVTLLGCEVHSSLTGHNIKSRAHVTRIIACYVHDSANREIDLVDGKSDTTIPESDAWLEGNIIVKGEKGQGNRGVIHFGQDGGHEHNGTLYLRHNTIVTPFISPVVQLSSKLAKVRFFNNIISDGGTHRNGQVLLSLGDHAVAPGIVEGSNNWLASGFQGTATESWALPHTVIGEKGAVLPWVDPVKGDYRLTKRDLLFIDQGMALPDTIKASWQDKLWQYRHPQGHEARPLDGKPDLGAYEFVEEK